MASMHGSRRAMFHKPEQDFATSRSSFVALQARDAKQLEPLITTCSFDPEPVRHLQDGELTMAYRPRDLACIRSCHGQDLSHRRNGPRSNLAAPPEKGSDEHYQNPRPGAMSIDGSACKHGTESRHGLPTTSGVIRHMDKHTLGQRVMLRAHHGQQLIAASRSAIHNATCSRVADFIGSIR